MQSWSRNRWFIDLTSWTEEGAGFKPSLLLAAAEFNNSQEISHSLFPLGRGGWRIFFIRWQSQNAAWGHPWGISLWSVLCPEHLSEILFFGYLTFWQKTHINRVLAITVIKQLPKYCMIPCLLASFPQSKVTQELQTLLLSNSKFISSTASSCEPIQFSLSSHWREETITRT
jgi:hypothetical protein